MGRAAEAIAAGIASGVMFTGWMSFSVILLTDSAYESKKSDGDSGLKPTFLPLKWLTLVMSLVATIASPPAE